MSLFNKKFNIKFLSNKNSIIHRLIRGYIIIILVILLTFSISMFFMFEDKNKYERNLLKQSTEQILNNVDSQIDSMIQISKLPLFYQNALNKLNNVDDYVNFSYQINAELYPIYDSIINMNNRINYININNLSGYEFSYIKGKTSYGTNIDDRFFYKEAIDKFGVPIILPIFEIEHIGSKGSVNKSEEFGVIRAIVNPQSLDIVGTITLGMSIDFIDEIISNNIIYNDQRIIIIDKNEKVVYDSHNELEVNSCLNDFTEKIDNKYELIKKQSDTSGWTILNYIPIKEFNKQIMSYQNTLILIMFIATIIVIAIIINLSKYIIKPLENLMFNMDKLKQGDLNVHAKVINHDEFGTLTDNFNDMVQDLKKLIEESYIKEAKQKQLELDMLQNQINPHFIYNTLEAINMVCQIEEVDEASEMINSLSLILRYGISRKKDKVTLKEEIDISKLYLDLQKNRYSNLEKYEFLIPEYLENREVLKLVLQPIIENSIYHGLNRKKSGGIIRITAYEESGILYIKIFDNGSGIKEEEVKLLNDYINEKNECFTSIGLKNVNIRIKIKYGDEYGIKLYSYSEGTEVIVKLPSIECN